MDKGTEIVLKAVIANLAKLDGAQPFLHGLSQSLFGTIEEQLVGDPVTTREVGGFAALARDLSYQISN